jgi:hypothetical protein
LIDGQAARAGAAGYSPFTPPGSGRPNPTKGEIMLNLPPLIAQLLTGPANVRLSDGDCAFLCAFLNQPGNRPTLMQVAGRESDPLANLRLIKSYNKEFRASAVGTQPTDAGSDATESTPPPPAKTETSEGKGGAGPTPEQPATDPNAKRKEVLAGLQPADRKAYLAYQYAETMAEKRLQDREAYDWLHENGIDAGKGDVGELADYKLPVFDTWAKQLRNARKPLGEQKYTRRGGRNTGRSIVSEREIEYRGPEPH